jgi:Fe2+ or Zn2+ uptake regulation protein
MNIEGTLISQGHKLTETRKSIAFFVSGYKGIFSAKELMDTLPTLDKVSVYRTLELFELLDIIHPVLVQHGEKHYELHSENHHHHAVCTGCEKASCVDCEVTRTKAKGFSTLHHSVVYTGLCTSCAPA